MGTYLIKYEPWTGAGYHTRGFMYDLYLLKVSFFGLRKREVKTSILIPYDCSIKQTTDKWDALIKNKTKVTWE